MSKLSLLNETEQKELESIVHEWQNQSNIDEELLKEDAVERIMVEFLANINSKTLHIVNVGTENPFTRFYDLAFVLKLPIS